jgi:hypothetical protein
MCDAEEIVNILRVPSWGASSPLHQPIHVVVRRCRLPDWTKQRRLCVVGLFFVKQARKLNAEPIIEANHISTSYFPPSQLTKVSFVIKEASAPARSIYHPPLAS